MIYTWLIRYIYLPGTQEIRGSSPGREALQYTHYQDVFGTLDVDKWTYEVHVAPEYK